MNEFHDEHFLTEKFKSEVVSAVMLGKNITLITYVLGDSGEAKLKYIINTILHRYEKPELMELLYTTAKELIVNSTKAAIKRIFFKERGLNLSDEFEYESGMESFKENLTDKKFPHYKKFMKDNGFSVKIRFHYDSKKIILKIINNFPLIKQEEVRIREKFQNAKKYENLFEFYMDHGDNTEGAGMGITMVEILLAQSGFDRHLFTIYSSNIKKETVARVEIPIAVDYKPKRLAVHEKIQDGAIGKDDIHTIRLPEK